MPVQLYTVQSMVSLTGMSEQPSNTLAVMQSRCKGLCKLIILYTHNENFFLLLLNIRHRGIWHLQPDAPLFILFLIVFKNFFSTNNKCPLMLHHVIIYLSSVLSSLPAISFTIIKVMNDSSNTLHSSLSSGTSPAKHDIRLLLNIRAMHQSALWLLVS